MLEFSFMCTVSPAAALTFSETGNVLFHFIEMCAHIMLLVEMVSFVA